MDQIGTPAPDESRSAAWVWFQAAASRPESQLRGNPQQLLEALSVYRQIGVDHLALQFMVPRWPERMEQIERFAREVMPRLRG